MRIGKRKFQISILNPISTSRSTDGEPIFSYSTIIRKTWAAVDTLNAREVWRNDYRWEITDKIFNIRYTTVSITPNMVIRYSSEDYQIQSIVDLGERHREFEMVARKTT